MENNRSSLETILERAALFSDEIDRLNGFAHDVNKEKTKLTKKEQSLEKDLLSTAETMHKFLYETISKMTELYAKIQCESDNEESAKGMNIRTTETQ